MVQAIDSVSFAKEVLQADCPVVVDFWAEWCGPCRMLGPVLEKASELLPQAKFCKLNVDSAVDLAQQYGVSSIPCVVVFSKGREVGRHVGFAPNLPEVLKGYIGNAEL